MAFANIILLLKKNKSRLSHFPIGKVACMLGTECWMVFIIFFLFFVREGFYHGNIITPRVKVAENSRIPTSYTYVP